MYGQILAVNNSCNLAEGGDIPHESHAPIKCCQNVAYIVKFET
jgi:hypothetical protein